MNQILSKSILLCLFLPLAALAQTEDELSLRQDFSDYFMTIQERQVEKTMSYIYPKLFDQVPKEEIIKAMEEIYNDPEIQIKLTRPTIKSIDKMLLHEQGKCTKLNYSFIMQMSFPQLEEEEEEEEELTATAEDEEEDEFELDFGSFMLEVFQAQYGKKNVQYLAEQKVMEINFDTSMFAFWEPEYPDSWKFLENEKSKLTKMKTVVPKPVWKYLKKNAE